MILPGARDALQEPLERRWWLIAVRGLAAILFGIICCATPAVAGLSLLLLFGALRMGLDFKLCGLARWLAAG